MTAILPAPFDDLLSVSFGSRKHDLGYSSSSFRRTVSHRLDLSMTFALLPAPFDGLLVIVWSLKHDLRYSSSSLQRTVSHRLEVESMTLAILPAPFDELENGIRELPVDMFSEMPSLTYLYLGGNPIMVLDAQTFQPIWDQLKIVILSDILHCDCRMSWMPRMEPKFRLVKATCNTPAKLRGQNPADMKTVDLEC
ncbi:hypothetical protein AVEN_168821-1 [Araneus ventricosus]|uniref:LRRCT domain-containing protein n=1 Tax=Araneus ventricosus TaxID=182803 RepID=A0A4Y2P9V3_ARAVE|nr:hypothetical protein AVEN_168821-1 [Araneus ventricosus]